jgi:hypothetical protein
VGITRTLTGAAKAAVASIAAHMNTMDFSMEDFPAISVRFRIHAVESGRREHALCNKIGSDCKIKIIAAINRQQR